MSNAIRLLAWALFIGTVTWVTCELFVENAVARALARAQLQSQQPTPIPDRRDTRSRNRSTQLQEDLILCVACADWVVAAGHPAHHRGTQQQLDFLTAQNLPRHSCVQCQRRTPLSRADRMAADQQAEIDDPRTRMAYCVQCNEWVNDAGHPPHHRRQSTTTRRGSRTPARGSVRGRTRGNTRGNAPPAYRR